MGSQHAIPTSYVIALSEFFGKTKLMWTTTSKLNFSINVCDQTTNMKRCRSYIYTGWGYSLLKDRLAGLGLLEAPWLVFLTACVNSYGRVTLGFYHHAWFSHVRAWLLYASMCYGAMLFLQNNHPFSSNALFSIRADWSAASQRPSPRTS